MSSRRVLRGGSWVSKPQLARTANRFRVDSTFRDDNFGFRLVREPESLSVIRGGAWGNYPVDARPANRINSVSTGRSYDLGFRLVREPK